MSDAATEIPADAWIVAECQYTEPDVRQYLGMALRRGRRRMRGYSMALAAGIVFFGFGISFIRQGPPLPGLPPASIARAWADSLSSVWPALALFLVFVFVMRRLLRRQLSKRNMQKFGPLQRPRLLIFTPRGVSMREPLAATEYAWGAFCEWRELQGMFVLFQSENSAELVLKRSIRDPAAHGAIGDAAALERFRGILCMCIDGQRLQQPGFPLQSR